MVNVGKHRKQSPAKDARTRHGEYRDDDYYAFPAQASQAVPLPDFTLDSLEEEEESLVGDGDGSHERMRHLLGAIQLQNPIRLQSPIYLENSQRAKAKPEDEFPKPETGFPKPEDEFPQPEDEFLREDTVIMVAIRERPALDVAARSLAEEDSQDNDGTHEHMQRLFSGIHLRVTGSQPALPQDLDDDVDPDALDDEWEQAQRETPNHQEQMHRLFGSMYF